MTGPMGLPPSPMPLVSTKPPAFTAPTAPYFSAGALLLPVCCGYRYEEGAEAKLLPAFGAGSALFLIFLAVFFSVFGTLGEKEHYALMKTAQFFPALRYVGRIDLLMVYLVTVVLFFYTALPLQLYVDGIRMLLPIKRSLGRCPLSLRSS